MAVLTDIGSPGDIHPRNKQDVGARLARWALNRDYDRKDIVPSGPLYKSMKVEASKIRVNFAYADGGLKSRDNKPLTDFEIATADGKFVTAKAEIEGNTVVVAAEGVASPTQVRFCWNGVANPNLVNQAGLPAGPFRSQDWQGATGE
jgi:sialate O-acetylesterase